MCRLLTATLNFYKFRLKLGGELRNRLLDVYNLRMKSCHLDNTKSDGNINDTDRDRTVSTDQCDISEDLKENVFQ